MRIIRFTSAVSCGILRPSQRAFGTYLCVYRKEDDHTTPDRKSSGWMILSAVWLRRTVSPAVEWVEDGRFFLFLLHAVRVKKSASLRMVTQRRTFCMRSLYILLSAGDIHFRRISSPYIHPCLYTALSPHPVIFPHISCPNTAASITFLPAQVRRSPRLSPSILPNGPALLSPAMFPSLVLYTYSCPRPAILTVALSPVPSQVGMQLPKASLLSALFRLLYCFANGLPLPVDPDCIQCLMYEKLSCFR